MRQPNIYEEAKFQGQLWTPLNATIGVPAWWLAWDGGVWTDSDGSGLTAWRDRLNRPNSNATAGSVRAQLQANGVYFGATGDVNRAMPIGSAATGINGSDWTLATFCHNDGTSAAHSMIGGSSGIGIRFQNATTAVTLKSGVGVGGSATVASGWYSLVGRQNGATVSAMSANGGAESTAAVDLREGTGSLTIGQTSGANPITSWVREAMGWHASLSPIDIVKLHGYFAWTHSDVGGPALLPASHPFRNRPPLIGD